jgi:hypothetical protein
MVELHPCCSRDLQAAGLGLFTDLPTSPHLPPREASSSEQGE